MMLLLHEFSMFNACSSWCMHSAVITVEVCFEPTVFIALIVAQCIDSVLMEANFNSATYILASTAVSTRVSTFNLSLLHKWQKFSARAWSMLLTSQWKDFNNDTHSCLYRRSCLLYTALHNATVIFNKHRYWWDWSADSPIHSVLTDLTDVRFPIFELVVLYARPISTIYSWQ